MNAKENKLFKKTVTNMGGKQSLIDSGPSHLTKAEVASVTEHFRSVCQANPSKGCTYDDFVNFCEQIHPLLTQYLVEFYFGQKTDNILESVKEFVSIYVLLIRGSIEDKAKVMEILLLGTTEDSAEGKAHTACLKDHRKFLHLEINYNYDEHSFTTRLENYLRGLLCSAIKIEFTNEYEEFKSWRQIKGKIRISDIDKLTLAMTEHLDNPTCSDDIVKWIRTWRTTNLLNEMVYNYLFGISETTRFHQKSLYPMCASKHRRHVGLLDMCSILYLNSHLPSRFRHKWRLLFSSYIHGWNFRHLTEKILFEGASVVVIRDSDDYIFGGFASESWHPSKSFYGNCSSFLFQAEPILKIYDSSGQDDNYQYMELKGHNKGFGMGRGAMDLCAWWIEPDRQRGSCAISCYTFQDVPVLASSQHFHVDRLEVWCLVEESARKSKNFVRYHTITKSKNIDSNLYESGKSILTRTGTKKYTDGYAIDAAQGKWDNLDEDDGPKHSKIMQDEEEIDDDDEDDDDDDEETDGGEEGKQEDDEEGKSRHHSIKDKKKN